MIEFSYFSFHGNVQSGGSIYAEKGQKFSISDSNFQNNFSFEKGGAIFMEKIDQIIIKNT